MASVLSSEHRRPYLMKWQSYVWSPGISGQSLIHMIRARHVQGLGPGSRGGCHRGAACAEGWLVPEFLCVSLSTLSFFCLFLQTRPLDTCSFLLFPFLWFSELKRTVRFSNLSNILEHGFPLCWRTKCINKGQGKIMKDIWEDVKR